MKKRLCFCDHCGKEIDALSAFADVNIDNFIDHMKVDLCRKCFRELNDIVLQYVNTKKDA